MVPPHETPMGADPGPADVAAGSAVERVIDAVVDLIASGQLGPRECLPPEAKLAASLGVSRSSLREAVRVLSYLGVLDVRVGDGTYVTALDGTTLLGGLNLVGRVATESTIDEIFEIRRLLDAGAASIAAGRMTGDQLSAIRCVLDELRVERDGERFVRLDEQFHDLIVQATGNAALRTLSAGLAARTKRGRLVRSRHGAAELEQSIREHEAIYEQLAAGDAVLASAAAALHVDAVARWLRRSARSTDALDRELESR